MKVENIKKLNTENDQIVFEPTEEDIFIGIGLEDTRYIELTYNEAKLVVQELQEFLEKLGNLNKKL